jgi:AcrR family transcriptional regulator
MPERTESNVHLARAGRPVPRSRRGQSTRTSLLRAARTVFERDGFLEAKIIDIAAEAGVATGSFYTYFTDKDDAFAALVEATQEEMLHAGVHVSGPLDDPASSIERANRAYLESYRRNAKLMKLFEQVATIDEGFRELRRNRTLAFLARNARMIRELQRNGLADPELDPDLASFALSAMVSRLAYSVFAIEVFDADLDALVRTATRLWVSALRIPEQRSHR